MLLNIVPGAEPLVQVGEAWWDARSRRNVVTRAWRQQLS